MKKAFRYYFDLFPEIMVRDDGICDHKHRKETEMYVKALSLFTVLNMLKLLQTRKNAWKKAKKSSKISFCVLFLR